MVKKKKVKKSFKKKFFIFLIKIPYYLVLLIYYIIKGIIKGIIFLINKIIMLIKSRKKKEIKRPSNNDFNLVHTDIGSFSEFESELLTSESKIGLILGARGSGKTAIGVRILEKVHINTKKKCYAIGFEQSEMPSFINVVDDIKKITNNSFVLIDEGGILFSSRNAMTTANKILSQLIMIARHKNLTILFISQNSANIEVNVIRQADFLILKPSSLLQKDFERKIIKNIYEEIESSYKRYSSKKGITYIYSDKFKGFITNTLPSFWQERISKSFRNR
jgi:hypothetical protein